MAAITLNVTVNIKDGKEAEVRNVTSDFLGYTGITPAGQAETRLAFLERMCSEYLRASYRDAKQVAAKRSAVSASQTEIDNTLL